MYWFICLTFSSVFWLQLNQSSLTVALISSASVLTTLNDDMQHLCNVKQLTLWNLISYKPKLPIQFHLSPLSSDNALSSLFRSYSENRIDSSFDIVISNNEKVTGFFSISPYWSLILALSALNPLTFRIINVFIRHQLMYYLTMRNLRPLSFF